MSLIRPRRNLVLSSLEAEDGGRCVDIFQRLDGTFGFEEYRRDSEDGRGWFMVGSYGREVYGTEAETRATADRIVPWLSQARRR